MSVESVVTMITEKHAYAPPELSDPAITRMRFAAILNVETEIDCRLWVWTERIHQVTFPCPAIRN